MQHQAWVTKAEAEGLVKFEDAEVTVKSREGVEIPGGKATVPFKKAVFIVKSQKAAGQLFALAEAAREDGDESNRIEELLAYAYGLECRAKVRAEFESANEDPDKALRKLAAGMVKQGLAKTEEKALVMLKAMREDEEDAE